MQEIYQLILGEERALYGLSDARVSRCRFSGAEDGESALKECRDIAVEECEFQLRYPLWHVTNAKLRACVMTETCRAPLWYDQYLFMENCDIRGVKALRECDNVRVTGGSADSTEFGWMCRDVSIRDFELASEYPFFHTRQMNIERLRLKGKYSFQYAKDVTITNSYLDTKDAFWHSENVTVTDSVIRGEYLAWYSKNLKLTRCKIIGTQPLCYCENLALIDCELENADLSFENSHVNADIIGGIDSVKNPLSGHITADYIGEIILDEHLRPGANCAILAKSRQIRA